MKKRSAEVQSVESGPRRFAVLFCLTGHADRCEAFLIKAEDENEAMDILTEELGMDFEDRGEAIWSAASTLRWRAEWRHGRVKVLTATVVPAGIV